MALGFADLNNVQRIPDKSFTTASKPRVLKIQFGDGYEQRVAEGINNLTQNYSITFNNRPKEVIDDIIAFFVNKGGTTAFDFTYPDSKTRSGISTY